MVCWQESLHIPPQPGKADWRWDMLQFQIIIDLQSAHLTLLTCFKEKRYLPTALCSIWQLSCTVTFPEDLFHSLIDLLSILTLLDFQDLPMFSYQLPETWPDLLAWLLYPASMGLFSLSLMTWIQWFFLILWAGQYGSAGPDSCGHCGRDRINKRLFCFGGCQAVKLQAGKGSLTVFFPSCSLNEYNLPF